MRDFIISLLEHSAQGSIVILAVLSLRFIFDKFGLAKKYTNLLWIVPFICLILPWKIESDFSIWNAVPELSEAEESFVSNYQPDNMAGGILEVEADDDLPVNDGHFVITLPDFSGNSAAADNAGNHMAASDSQSSGDVNLKNNAAVTKVEVDVYEMVSAALAIVWFLGLLGFTLYGVISYIRLLRKVRENIPLKDNTYYVDDVETPFVLGVLKPHIYIPSYMRSGNLECMLEHEKTHIARLDHIKKILAFGVLCIHWFNPLVWLAFYILEKDIEMACDEVTVERIGESRRAEYAEILLAMSTSKNKFFSVPVAFGEQGVKSRIKNIVKSKVTIGVAAVLVVLLVIVLSVIFLTDANEIKGDEQEINTSVGENFEPESQETTTNNYQEETTDKSTEAELREFTMAELLELCEGSDADFLHLFRTQGKEGRLIYSNFDIEDTADNRDYWHHICKITYDGKEYLLKSSYTKRQGTTVLKRPVNSLDLMTLTHIASGDYMVIVKYNYTDNSGGTYTLNDELVKEFVNREYEKKEYFSFDIPKGMSITETQAGTASKLIWGFEGDFDELSDGVYDDAKKEKNFVEAVWSSIGYIQVAKNGSESLKCRYEDDKFVKAYDEIISADEPVTGCDMQALAGSGGAYVYTLSEEDDFEAVNGVKPDDELTYWAVVMAEPDSEYVYMVYLNQRYFTKEETIAFAKTIDIVENN